MIADACFRIRVSELVFADLCFRIRVCEFVLSNSCCQIRVLDFVWSISCSRIRVCEFVYPDSKVESGIFSYAPKIKIHVPEILIHCNLSGHFIHLIYILCSWRLVEINELAWAWP